MADIEDELRAYYADQPDDPDAEQRIREQITDRTSARSPAAKRSRRRVAIVVGSVAAAAIAVTIAIPLTQHHHGNPIGAGRTSSSNALRPGGPTAQPSASHTLDATQTVGSAADARVATCGPNSPNSTDTFKAPITTSSPVSRTPTEAAVQFTEHGTPGYGTPTTKWITEPDPNGGVILHTNDTWLHILNQGGGWTVNAGGHCR
jgi:hypothetical protein